MYSMLLLPVYVLHAPPPVLHLGAPKHGEHFGADLTSVRPWSSPPHDQPAPPPSPSHVKPHATAWSSAGPQGLSAHTCVSHGCLSPSTRLRGRARPVRTRTSRPHAHLPSPLDRHSRSRRRPHHSPLVCALAGRHHHAINIPRFDGHHHGYQSMSSTPHVLVQHVVVVIHRLHVVSP